VTLERKHTPGRPDAKASGCQPDFVAGFERAKPEGLAYVEAVRDNAHSCDDCMNGVPDVLARFYVWATLLFIATIVSHCEIRFC